MVSIGDYKVPIARHEKIKDWYIEEIKLHNRAFTCETKMSDEEPPMLNNLGARIVEVKEIKTKSFKTKTKK